MEGMWEFSLLVEFGRWSIFPNGGIFPIGGNFPYWWNFISSAVWRIEYSFSPLIKHDKHDLLDHCLLSPFRTGSLSYLVHESIEIKSSLGSVLIALLVETSFRRDLTSFDVPSSVSCTIKL